MKIGYIYKEIGDAMSLIGNINFIDYESRPVRLENQRKINKAYNKLNDIRDGLVRESIISKQKRNKNQEGTNE